MPPLPAESEKEFEANGSLAQTMTTTLGQYEIVRSIGHGGMGSVYEARHKYLNKRIALKVISPKMFGEMSSVRRFMNEMQAVGRLHHPNVVQAFDAGEWQGTHYLAMEYVDGLDVEQLARSPSLLSVPDCCEIIRQAALGLAHAHHHGLVHRDIKPSNLICARDGRVVVLDLGLAQLREGNRSDLSQTGWIIGTPDYISPEQADSRKTTDHRCDLYSLGATLFRLLAGRPPFSDPKYDSTIRKLNGHIKDPPPSLHSIRPNLPEPLVQLVEQLLAKSPDQRPQFAQDVAVRLAEWAEGANLVALVQNTSVQPKDDASLVATRSHSPVTREDQRHAPSRPRQRLTVLSAVLGLVLVGIVGGVFLSSLTGRDKPSAPPESAPRPETSPLPAPQIPENSLTRSALEPRPFEDLAPSEWTTDIWYPLLNRAPRSVRAEFADGLSTIGFDSNRRQLSVTSRDLTILQLGVMTHASYTLEIDLFQTNWTGGFGVFLGLNDDGPDRSQLYCIRVSPNHAADRQQFPLLLTASQYDLRAVPDRTIAADLQNGPACKVPTPEENDPCTLQLSVRQGRLDEVKWNGARVEPLSRGDAFENFGNPELMGGFGVVVASDHAIFQNARIRVGK